MKAGSSCHPEVSFVKFGDTLESKSQGVDGKETKARYDLNVHIFVVLAVFWKQKWWPILQL